MQIRFENTGSVGKLLDGREEQPNDQGHQRRRPRLQTLQLYNRDPLV